MNKDGKICQNLYYIPNSAAGVKLFLETCIELIRVFEKYRLVRCLRRKTCTKIGISHCGKFSLKKNCEKKLA